MDVEVDDEDKAIVLLCSLPESYEHVVTTLTYGKETIKTKDITSALLARDQMRKNKEGETSQVEGLLVKEDHAGHKVKKNKRKKMVQCFRCDELGHISRECPTLKGKAKANAATSSNDSDSDGCDLLTMSSAQSKNAEVWILDSASLFHVTPRKEWFSSYKSGECGFVYLGDDTSYPAVGVGEVKIKLEDGGEHVLQGVKHVPGLKRNLISLGTLHEEGLIFHGNRNRKTIEIMKGKMTVMTGEKVESHLYKLQGCTVAGGVQEEVVAGIAIVFVAAGLA